LPCSCFRGLWLTAPWFLLRTPSSLPCFLPSVAALLILVVTKGYGVARLRLVTCAVLVVLVIFLYGVGPFFSIPAVGASKRVIHLLDRSYSAARWLKSSRPSRLKANRSPSFASGATSNSGSRSIETVKWSTMSKTAFLTRNTCS